MDPVAAVLFGKTRQAVLSRLFSFPGETVYLRELARLTGISTGSLQKELNQLVGADLVLRTQDGNRVRYAANTASPVFEELRGLVLKTAGLHEQLRAALAPLGSHIELALIYGSIAAGRAVAASDVDLLVVGDLKFPELLQALQPLEQTLGREINPRLFDPEEFARRRHAQDRFLSGVLAGPTVLLTGALDDAG